MKDQEDSTNDFLQNYYLESKSRLAENSVYYLVNTFNRETMCRGWTGTRGAFLRALMDTFTEKGVNIDAVSSSFRGLRSTSFKYPVELTNDKDGTMKLEQIVVDER
ncbi:MAG TPA: hypothetical protein PKD85_15025 [Saprospiraceae bacterium]|nr:hypothetical protein [Saprospiraceae bacterium]